MRIHPLVATPALLSIVVVAVGVRLVAQRHASRARVVEVTTDVPEGVVAPYTRRVFPAVSQAWAAPSAVPETPAGATLRLRVTGPHGLLIPGVDATAVRQGDAEETSYGFDAGDDDDGTLSLTDVPPGRYDVVVEAPGLRTARVAGLPTGVDIVALSLDRAPLLLGAIGAPGPAGCAGVVRATRSSPRVDGNATTAETDADDCTFALEALPDDGVAGPGGFDAGPLVVAATVAGRVERALVTLPLVGDPAAVCLAPPCAVVPASLAIFVADDAGRQVDGALIEWSLLGDDLRGEMGTLSLSGSGFTYLHGRRAGQTLQLEANVDGRKTATTVVVGVGVTDVVLTVPGAANGGATPREEPSIRLVGEEDARPPSRESARGLVPSLR
jgi:hypothetical protein